MFTAAPRNMEQPTSRRYHFTVAGNFQGTATKFLFKQLRHQGRIQEFAKGGQSLPFPSSPLLLPSPLARLPSPLEIGSLKPAGGSGERCKLPQWGPGRSRGRKRIWCTLKLS